MADAPLRQRLASSGVATILAPLIRLRAVLRHLRGESAKSFRWLVSSRETTNYNYALSALNRIHLMWWVAEIAGIGVEEVSAYFEEIENDHELVAHVGATTRASRFHRVADTESELGRRVAWYALVRALRPEFVVETGIEKGFGTCVLAAAVLHNGRGRVLAVDTNDASGWLVAGHYATVVDVEVADAAQAITTRGEPIDILFHDVHYTAEQEADEYAATLPLLRPGGVIVNDNGHGYPVLPELAAAKGWRFIHFQERPEGHWYPGAGMSAAWDPGRTNG